MKKVLPIIAILLVVVIGLIIWQRSTPKTVITPKPEVTQAESEIKKIDLATQPEWVQKLSVTAKKSTSGNGLANVTLTVSGIDSKVDSLTYVVQYQTTNKGVQGALAMTPLKITGGKLVKTIDLGTCSTKSCVRHDGVTSLEIELDFSDSSVWTGTAAL